MADTVVSVPDDAIRSLFEVNMGMVEGERVVVFTDMIRPEEEMSDSDRDRRTRLSIAAGEVARHAEAGFGNTRFVSYPSTSGPGAEPPEVLWRAALGDRVVDLLSEAELLVPLLLKEASPEQISRAEQIAISECSEVADVIIGMANNSTSHTRFRALVNAAGGRFASLPNFDPEMFHTSMRVDWHLLAERTARLAAAVNRGSNVLVECPNGTRMEFGIRGRTAKGDDGLLSSPGSFGNLPAGEVYLAPVEGTSEGIMIVEYAPTRRLESPLKLTVRSGSVVEINGNDPYRDYLEHVFEQNPKSRNVAELGIGTNDRASRPDNILEAEKILGTIHIALGDNSGFGGIVSTPFHEDYVFYRPTLRVVSEDGTSQTLLADGTLQI